MNVDERLRETLHRRAESVEPAVGGWSAVNARIERRQRRAHTLSVSLVTGMSFAAVVLAVVLTTVAGRDAPDQNVAAGGPDVGLRPTTTYAPPAGPESPTDGVFPTVPGQIARPDPDANPQGGATTIPTPMATTRNYTPNAVWPETLTELEAQQAAADEGHQPWRNDPTAVASAYLSDRGLPVSGVGAPSGDGDVDIRYAFSSMAGGRVHLSRLLDGSIYYVSGSSTEEISELHAVRQGDRLSVDVTARQPGNLVVRTKQPGSDWNDSATRTVVADQPVSLTVDGPAATALIVQVRLQVETGYDGLAETYLGASILGFDDESLHNGSTLRFGGIGPVDIGMTLAEAERVAGVGMITNAGEHCTTLDTMGRPERVSLISTRGDGRVDVIIVSAPGVRTEAGIGVESTVDQVRAAYPGIEERLTDGRGRLVLRPSEPVPVDFEMFFEVIDGKVVDMWSGHKDLANTDELCA